MSFLRDVNPFLPKALLASDLVLWLCWLPLMLRIQTIPSLLKRLAGSEAHLKKTQLELGEVIWIVTRVCNLRVFRSRVFPKLCLRQSLTLYRALANMGYPVGIHFGVRKDENNLTGHSWVTMEGRPVADTTSSAIFKVVYSHPSSARETNSFKNGAISKPVKTKGGRK